MIFSVIDGTEGHFNVSLLFFLLYCCSKAYLAALLTSFSFLQFTKKRLLSSHPIRIVLELSAYPGTMPPSRIVFPLGTSYQKLERCCWKLFAVLTREKGRLRSE